MINWHYSKISFVSFGFLFHLIGGDAMTIISEERAPSVAHQTLTRSSSAPNLGFAELPVTEATGSFPAVNFSTVVFSGAMCVTF